MMDTNKERRGRKAIGLGAAAMLAFAALFVIWTGLVQLSGYHVPPPPRNNPGWPASVVFGLASLAGLGAVIYGIVLLARDRRRHPRGA